MIGAERPGAGPLAQLTDRELTLLLGHSFYLGHALRVAAKAEQKWRLYVADPGVTYKDPWFYTPRERIARGIPAGRFTPPWRAHLRFWSTEAGPLSCETGRWVRSSGALTPTARASLHTPRGRRD